MKRVEKESKIETFDSGGEGVVTLGVGQGGIQIASEWWARASSE
jgi:hypothetical protein